MTELLSDPLEAGREAARRLAWREAYEHLSGADTNGNLTGEDLANLGEAAYWTGRLEEAIAFRERAVAALHRRGRAAARRRARGDALDRQPDARR